MIKTSIEFVELMMYNFYIVLLINCFQIIISWDDPCTHYIGLPTSSYLWVPLWSLTFTHGTEKARIKAKKKWIISMKVGGYSFEFCQERVDKCHTQGYFPPFHLSIQLTLQTSNSLLSMIKASLTSDLPDLTWSYLAYPHVPDKTWMNNHQASYLVSICSNIFCSNISLNFKFTWPHDFLHVVYVECFLIMSQILKSRNYWQYW